MFINCVCDVKYTKLYETTSGSKVKMVPSPFPMNIYFLHVTAATAVNDEYDDDFIVCQWPSLFRSYCFELFFRIITPN